MNDTINSPDTGFDTVTRIVAYGDYPFTAASQDKGVKGDRVLWYNNWYECTSSVYWDMTPLHHWISNFTIVPDGGEDLEYRGAAQGSL